MPLPHSGEYNEAIQNLASAISDEELRYGEPALNAMGVPMPYSGGFADVYKVHCPKTGNTWAVKCFTRESPSLRERYREISAHLERAKLPFAVDFQFVEPGVHIGAQWYPFLKMRWVEGLNLNRFVAGCLDKPKRLRQLLTLWVRLAVRLREASTAHADLQHGNVLLVPAGDKGGLALRLIDYDGMWVPALAGGKSGEVGHPSYQHPQRLREGIYSAEVDRFSHLAIYTAIHCLTEGRRPLWERFDTSDNLLFCHSDYLSPDTSDLFQQLWHLRDPGTHALVGRLILACQVPLDRVPRLDEIVADGAVRPLELHEEKQLALIMGEAAIRAVSGGPDSSAIGVPHAHEVSPAPLAAGAAQIGKLSGLPGSQGTLPLGGTGTAPAAANPAQASAWWAADELPPATVPVLPTRTRKMPGAGAALRWMLWIGLAPLRPFDHLLGRLAGEGNTILHNFFRVVAVGVLTLLLCLDANTARTFFRSLFGTGSQAIVSKPQPADATVPLPPPPAPTTVPSSEKGLLAEAKEKPADENAGPKKPATEKAAKDTPAEETAKPKSEEPRGEKPASEKPPGARDVSPVPPTSTRKRPAPPGEEGPLPPKPPKSRVAQTEPLTIDLDKQIVTTPVRLAELPEISKVRVQITKVSGLDSEISPAKPVLLGEPIAVSFPSYVVYAGEEKSPVVLTVTFAARGAALEAAMEIADRRVFRELKAAGAPGVRAKQEANLKRFNEELRKTDWESRRKQLLEDVVRAANAKLKAADFYDAFKLAKIHYRVFVDVGSDAVEIANTRPAFAADGTRVFAVDLGNDITMEMVLIPAGSFTMGDDNSGENDEKPAHKVTITKPFYLGKYEVTQEQWQAVMGSNSSYFKGAKNPVEQVSWDDCQAFFAKLNEKYRSEGVKFSLPTEAQWEYACRAKSMTKYSFGDPESRLREYAWYHENSGAKTHPVGVKKPNGFGLHDMHGNVWEWCADWYDSGYYGKSEPEDPTGPATGSSRVNRGGSCVHTAGRSRSALRNGGSPGSGSIDLGLRASLVPADK